MESECVLHSAVTLMDGGERERESVHDCPVTFLLWTWTSDFTDWDQRGIVRERDEEKETKRIERGRGF